MSSRQLELGLGKVKCGWGGRRAGAGRPRVEGSVPHGRRPFHERAHPTHVTVKVAKRLKSMRRGKVLRPLFKRLRRVAHHPAFAKRRRTFRVVHFAVMQDHLHLIVEASSARALSRGMQGLLAWVARDVNRALERHGKLFPERFHARDLTRPREIRNAIKYVYLNHAKHRDFPRWFNAEPETDPVRGVDPCSSAGWFDGWKEPVGAQTRPAPVVSATVWLLTTGWRRHGLIGRDEEPAAA